MAGAIVLASASAILGGLFAVVVVLVLVWHWAFRHEAEIEERWARFRARPGVAAVVGRLRPAINFLQARLTPGGYLGLHVTLGALCLAAAVWGFGEIADSVLDHEALAAADQSIADWFHEHAAPGLTAALLGVTALGSPVVVTILTVTGAALLAARRDWYAAAALALSVGGGAIVNTALKNVFDRTRPHFEPALAHAHGYSFPSGHVALATLLYGCLAVVAARRIRSWRVRIAAVLGALLLVLLISFSRIYLGIHYLTDVLAAQAVGVAWLAIALTAIETLRIRRVGAVPPAAG